MSDEPTIDEMREALIEHDFEATMADWDAIEDAVRDVITRDVWDMHDLAIRDQYNDLFGDE